MIGLLIKDWKLFKNQGRYFFTVLLIALAVLFFNTREYSGFVTSYIIFLLAYFTLSTISYDEYDNCMEFLMALPVDRKTYVKEKYLLCVLLTFGAWILSVLLNLFFYLKEWAGMEKLQEMLYAQPVFLLVVLFFLSVSLPLFLKWGPEKGRIVSLGLVGAFLASLAVLGKVSGGRALDALDAKTLASPATAAGICLCLCIPIVAVSYLTSRRIVEKREF